MRTISVVIPSYNSAAHLGPCLESVLSQKIENVQLEIIVVDDASTDDTEQVLDAYKSRVIVLRSSQNNERAASRNRGARIASGEHLAFLDADDWWHPHKLAIQLERLPSAPSITGYFLVSKRCLPGPLIDQERAFRRIWLENLFLGAPSSLVITKDLFFKLGGFPEEREVQGSEDWLFLFRLCSYFGSLQVIQDRLVYRRVHAQSHSASADSVARSMLHASRRMLAEPTMSRLKRRRLGSRTAMVIACNYARERRLERVALQFVKAMRAGGFREVAALLPSLLRGLTLMRNSGHG